MYQTLAVWETDPNLAAQSSLMADSARVWRAADKVVFCATLAAPMTANTRLERTPGLRLSRSILSGRCLLETDDAEVPGGLP